MKAKGRHIAIFSLQDPGHLYPMLGLCWELTRRGHRITYPATNPAAEKIRASGAEPLVLEVPTLTNAEKIRQYVSADDPRSWQLHASMFAQLTLLAAAAIVKETEGFYRENPPDLIVYDWRSFAGRILAGRLKCPAVNVWPHFAHQGYVIRERGVSTNPAPMIDFGHLVDAFMSAHGIGETNCFWHRENLNIVFIPREFQFDAGSFDDRFRFVGPSLNRPQQATWKNNSNGKPILLISESSWAVGNTFLRICIEAFRDSDYHVVFSVAPAWKAKDIALPANFEINKSAYNLEILPHAAAIVCQSGMGITLESMYFGVPIVAVPNHAYNTEVAERVVELGLGIHLPAKDLSAEAIRAAVDAVIADTALRGRVKTMQQAVRNCGGTELAADLIEQTLFDAKFQRQIMERSASSTS